MNDEANPELKRGGADGATAGTMLKRLQEAGTKAGCRELAHAKARFHQTDHGKTAFFVCMWRFGVWKGGPDPPFRFKVWRALELMGHVVFGPFLDRHLGEDP